MEVGSLPGSGTCTPEHPLVAELGSVWAPAWSSWSSQVVLASSTTRTHPRCSICSVAWCWKVEELSLTRALRGQGRAGGRWPGGSK